jgi:hypothetical protein
MGLLKVLGIGKYLKKVKEYTDQQIENLVGSAPETLDTLQELSTALKDNANIVDTLNNAISKKADKTSVDNDVKKLDEKIDNIVITTTEDIQVAGGPLANDVLENTDKWPETWYADADKTIKIIPENTSFEDLVRALFLKEENGTVSWGSKTWNPTVNKPSITLSKSGELEVGTKITISGITAGSITSNTNIRKVTCSATYGYFLVDADGNIGSYNSNKSLTIQKTGDVSINSTISYTYKWGGVAVNSNDTLTVGDGDNKLEVAQSGPTVTVDALPTTKVFASTNTKKLIPNSDKTLTDEKPDDKTLSNSNSVTVKGVRYAFTGSVGLDFVANSANIRDLLTKNGTSKSALTAMTAAAGGRKVVIAYPKTWGILSNVFDKKSNSEITTAFDLTVEPVSGVDGFSPIDYNVYIFTSEVNLDDINYSISIE